ncbi:MAG: DotU family type IV/VI secretion system protein [Spirochaetaceae bacterium]|jgi:type VI protein secretion system component VasF|nr:DotU family type IV/VI secretion system protein [Spirochaetaceae bacterium]
MKAVNSIETLCRPVFTCLCGYWQLNEAGNPPAMEKFREDIENALEDAKYAAASSPVLSRDYGRVELPLVFFIDYMVKEGNFPFKNEWRELARNYNELSGDEKFFNLLSSALAAPDAGHTIPVFYTMLGLGFDGVYVNDNKSIEKTMKECMTRISGEFDICHEPIVSIETENRLAESKKNKMPPFLRSLRLTLIGSLIFLVTAFIVNLFVFLGATSEFRRNLSEAAAAAREFEIQSGGASNGRR